MLQSYVELKLVKFDKSILLLSWEWIVYVNSKETRGVLCGLAIYIKKDLKAKEELWKLKYFTMQKYFL
jgi:hypothetical protein